MISVIKLLLRSKELMNKPETKLAVNKLLNQIFIYVNIAPWKLIHYIKCTSYAQ
jgi:hypothetical protein